MGAVRRITRPAGDVTLGQAADAYLATLGGAEHASTRRVYGRILTRVAAGPAGDISGYIGTSIPCGGIVNLDPLFDRQRRLDEIEIERTYPSRANQRPPATPAGKSRTA